MEQRGNQESLITVKDHQLPRTTEVISKTNDAKPHVQLVSNSNKNEIKPNALVSMKKDEIRKGLISTGTLPVRNELEDVKSADFKRN